MQMSSVIQYLFYFVSITLHLSYSVVVGILTHKGLLDNFDGNHFLIFLGGLGALMLTALFVYSLQRHRKTGRFVVPDVQLAFIFLFMLSEIFFTGIEFSGSKHFDCQTGTSGHANPCAFRPTIFGLAFSAGIILGIYFFAMLIGRFMCPGLLSQLSVDDEMESGLYVQELNPIPKVTTNRPPELAYPPTFSRRDNRDDGQSGRRSRRPPTLNLNSEKPIRMDVPHSATRSSWTR